MKHLKMVVGLVGIMGLLMALGCASQTGPSAKQPGFDRAGLFRALDDNKDGRISRDEYYRVYTDVDTAQRTFDSYDSNGDGFLGEREFNIPGITIFKF